MSTYVARPKDVERKWWAIDAENEILGRMAARVAQILMGKHKPTYTPNIDTGDFVVVTNAAKVQVTGRKREQRMYRYHTQRPGGLKEATMAEMLDRKPEEVVRLAVRRMLPKTRLGKKMLSKLKIFAGPNHNHQAQSPEKLELGTAR